MENDDITNINSLENKETDLSDIFTRIKNGDRELRHSYIEKNMRLAYDIANKFFDNIIRAYSNSYNYNMGIKDDIESFAFLGLVYAVDHFDPSRGNEFSTYAVKCIKDKINTEFRLSNNAIYVPKTSWQKHREAGKIDNDYYTRNGEHLSDKVLALAIGVSEESFKEYVKKAGIQVIGLEDLLYRNNNDEEEYVESSKYLQSEQSVTEEVEQNKLVEDLKEAIEILSEEEKIVLIKCNGLFGEREHTLEEVSKELACSREWARQLLIKAKRKLATYAENLRGYVVDSRGK